MRAFIGRHLRNAADRIDREHAVCVATTFSFTFERGLGLTLREDGRGCPIYYPSDEYDRAHTEADA